MPRKPRPVHLNAVHRAMTGAAALPRDAVTSACAGVRESLRRFSAGDYPREHWASMADALNVAEELAARRICSDAESRQLILAGQQVLADVMARHQAGGSWTLRGPEIATLSDALERHCIQLRFASYREYEDSIAAVRRKHAQYLAGNAPRDALVITGAIA